MFPFLLLFFIYFFALLWIFFTMNNGEYRIDTTHVLGRGNVRILLRDYFRATWRHGYQHGPEQKCASPYELKSSNSDRSHGLHKDVSSHVLGFYVEIYLYLDITSFLQLTIFIFIYFFL